MSEKLPTEFDVIVLGTGLTEAIAAAALARIGKRVLHIDRNDYYGGEWAAFTFDKLLEWIDQQQNFQADTPAVMPSFDENEEVNQTRLSFMQDMPTTLNIVVESYCDRTVPSNNDNHDDDNITDTKNATGEADSHEGQDRGDTEGTSQPTEAESDEAINQSSHEKSKHKYSFEDMRQMWRHFSLDLFPKLLSCRGSLVELLITSKVSRYVEFRSVTKVLTYKNNELVQVPCSRSEVFSSSLLTMLEKRILMKFISFCVDYERHEDEYQEYANRPFTEFLRSRHLNQDLQHFVIHCIAMVKNTATTIEGLSAAHRFLSSLGRFGETPFLWPFYGVGELPQAFCRLSAVYSGIYCLRMKIPFICTDNLNKCVGIITDEGQKISCDYLVANSSYLPSVLSSTELKRENSISRAIFVTNKSLYPTNTDELILLSIPSDNRAGLIRAVQLSSGSNACPDGLYIVHLTCPMEATAKEDLSKAATTLFEFEEKEGHDDSSKPQVLWCVYFNQVCREVKGNLPSNMLTIDSIDNEINFENVVATAKNIYEQISPNEEFIPSPPDPEDIIIDYSAENESAEDKASNELHTDQVVEQAQTEHSNDVEDVKQVDNELLHTDQDAEQTQAEDSKDRKM